MQCLFSLMFNTDITVVFNIPEHEGFLHGTPNKSGPYGSKAAGLRSFSALVKPLHPQTLGEGMCKSSLRLKYHGFALLSAEFLESIFFNLLYAFSQFLEFRNVIFPNSAHV